MIPVVTMSVMVCMTCRRTRVHITKTDVLIALLSDLL